MSVAPLIPGFSDPILGSQDIFRSILDAMAHPGSIEAVDDAICGVPHDIPLAAAACLLTLVDYDTPVWLAPEFMSIRSWLAFHTGAPDAASIDQTRFALMSAQSSSPAVTDFPKGDDRYPDLSATLIVVCTSLHGGRPIRLTGPGIESETIISPQGLHESFWTDVCENNSQFPLGSDIILVAGHELIALPRSITCEEIG
ncbi:MAG: phosphonate C-P lyase system protein PhnH [Alphaproteobacteria bacterium]